MKHDFEANFFTLLELLDMGSRLQIEAVCSPKSVQPLETICAQGEPAHSVYIVASGVVEMLTQSPDGQQTRSIGFMRRGDFFGDLAVLTGHPRLGSIRACEAVDLLQIEKQAFLSLLEKVPKMGAYFSRNLARRLHQTATEAHLNVYSLDLAGNLRHFDLLAIFRAIIGRGLSGQLQLHNSAHEHIGSFFFSSGHAEHARFAHLEGIEAVWQGVVQSDDGTFAFQVMDKPGVPFAEEYGIELGSRDLLSQGAARHDAYQKLSEPMRQLEGLLGRLNESLVWTDPETEALAGHLWEFIARHPQPLASMWRRVNYSSLTFLEVMGQLVNTGQAEWLSTPAPENQVDSQFLPKP